MLAARGQICLMVDADGATKFSDLDDLEAKLMKGEENGYGIAVGSRAHLVSTDAVVQVSTISILILYYGRTKRACNQFIRLCLITIIIAAILHTKLPDARIPSTCLHFGY